VIKFLHPDMLALNVSILSSAKGKVTCTLQHNRAVWTSKRLPAIWEESNELEFLPTGSLAGEKDKFTAREFSLL